MPSKKPLKRVASISIPMNGNYLLDTSIIIALFRGDSTIVERLQEVESVLIPITVVGELFYGVLKSNHREKNEAHLRAFLSESVVLMGDRETGYWYGFVKDNLRRKGHLIPENDIWIGAMALQFQLTVATRDKHFSAIDGLNIEMG